MKILIHKIPDKNKQNFCKISSSNPIEFLEHNSIQEIFRQQDLPPR